jgi:hypothetical protein
MAVLLFVPAASATIVGTLNTTNCPGGGVNVTSTAIDWFDPIAGGLGCIVANGSVPLAPLTYGSGTPFVLDTGGSILDLSSSGPPFTGGFVPGFMVFTSGGAPGLPGSDVLTFDLTQLGPGSANTNCASTPCSVVAGSPFVLLDTGGGVSVTLPASGFAHDNVTPGLSSFNGAFTTQIASFGGGTATALAIQQAFQADPNASLTSGGSTVAGQFTLAAVPEPVSMALIGGGLMALALLRRRRR